MKLTDQDVAPLVFALEESKLVKNLILAHNQIKDLTIFERLFQVNNTLEGIDLSDNPFSDEAAKRLTSLLSMRSNIQWFDLTKSTSEKKSSSKTHKKSESSCTRSKPSPRIPISLNNIHQRRPIPQKPKETGNRVFFRLNLYQGPHSARVRLQETDSGPEAPRFLIPEKSEREKDKPTGLSTINLGRAKDMFMSRIDWILKIKEIFYGLVSDNQEKVVSKSLIINNIKEKQQTLPFIAKDTYDRLYFEKGYSLGQVLEAIQSTKSLNLTYDDIIEIVCNIGNQKSSPNKLPSCLGDSTQEVETNPPKPQLENNKSPGDSETVLLHMLPIQQQIKPDYVECSFSLDNNNNNLGEQKEELSSKVSQNWKKPPKFIPKNITSKRSEIDNHHIPEYPASHNFDSRNQISSNSPTEVETARFNKESNQPSANKEKHESFKLEISSEISSFQDAGIRANESLSYDIDSTFNEMSTTAKIMSALGDTPQNLSNLNLFNLGIDRMSSFDPTMVSFTASEQTPQSATLRGTLKQFFGNKLYKQSETDTLGAYFGVNTLISNGYMNLSRQKNENLDAQIMKSNFTPRAQADRTRLNNQKPNDFESKVHKFNRTKYDVQEKICEEPERCSNVDDFERLLEQTKLNLKNKTDEESKRILDILDLFQIYPNDLYSLVSFAYDEGKIKKTFPYDSIVLKKLMKHMDALKLSHVSNLNQTLQNIMGAKLKILNLSYCNLTSADFLESFKSLELLNLSNNKLKALPMLGHCLKLKEIYISYNKFTELPNFFGFDEIFVISASFNLINSLETIANLTLNRKLHILDLTGNPITKKANYQNILKNILPQIQAIDVSGEDFSDFKLYKNVCFTQEQKPLICDRKEPNNPPKAAIMKFNECYNQSNVDISETEKTSLSPIKKKKTKNQIPKLNIQSLQSFDLSSIKSCGSTHLESSKLENRFHEQPSDFLDKKPFTERLEKRDDQVNDGQLCHRNDLSSKKLSREFFSSREHVSNKVSANHNQKNNIGSLRKPVRIIHPGAVSENKKEESFKSAKAKEKLGDHEPIKINLIRKASAGPNDESQKENVNTINRDNSKMLAK